MDADPQHVNYVVILNGALSVLMLVFGWLLNRVFTELDRLRQADAELAKQVSALAPLMIDRDMFDRHVDREESALVKLETQLATLVVSVQRLEVALALANHREIK